MSVKLGEIADVSTGYIKRENKRPAEPISIPIIQLRDMNVNGAIDYSSVSKEIISSKDRYPQLYAGDVIFAAKGGRRSAGVIDREVEGLTASNHYLIIRIKDEYKEKLLPEYLAFYFRQKPAMDYFEQCASGSHIPFITAAALKDLVIIFPEPEKQKQLVELDSLINKERQLVGKLQAKKKEYYEQLFAEKIGENRA